MDSPAFMLILVISGSKTQIPNKTPDSQEENWCPEYRKY